MKQAYLLADVKNADVKIFKIFKIQAREVMIYSICFLRRQVLGLKALTLDRKRDIPYIMT